jgi:hypothetical protein
MRMLGGKLLGFICENIEHGALGLGGGFSAMHQHRMTCARSEISESEYWHTTCWRKKTFLQISRTKSLVSMSGTCPAKKM